MKLKKKPVRLDRRFHTPVLDNTIKLNRANLLNRRRLDQEVSIERDLNLIGKMAACSVRRQCIFYRNVEV